MGNWYYKHMFTENACTCVPRACGRVAATSATAEEGVDAAS